MRTLRPVVVSLVLALTLAMLTAPSAGAASYIDSPPMPEISLLNLFPGSTVNFVGTITTDAGETPALAQVGLDFDGTFRFSEPVTAAAGTTAPFTIVVETEVLIANCVDDSITYAYWGAVGLSAYFIVTIPCSIEIPVIPAPIVTPVLPTEQAEVCGPDNDDITIPAQPTGIITNDSGWTDNKRTISFAPAPGYDIAGTTIANFVDDATPCPTQVPVTPTVEPTVEPTAEPSIEPPAESTTEPIVPPTSVPVVQSTVAPPAAVISLPSTGSGEPTTGVLLGFSLVTVIAVIAAAGIQKATRS